MRNESTMTLSKRKSRKIIVDDQEFRWSPSQDSGYMVLVAQHISGKGKKLEVIISDDKNIIVENGSYSIEVGSSSMLIITPKLVEQVIKDALEMGWNPLKNGPPVASSLNDNHQLQIRNGL